jgi:hypothetical protein
MEFYWLGVATMRKTHSESFVVGAMGLLDRKKMSGAGCKEYYLPEGLDGVQLAKHTRKDFDNVYESV